MKKMQFSLDCGRVLLGMILTASFSLVLHAEESKSLFEQRRAEVLAKFDKDQDGRLNATEREAVRTSKADGLKKGNSRRSQREEEPHPPELLALYDKDKSGWIDGDEWDVAGPAESSKIKKQFDANGDDELDEEEKGAIWGAIRSGKLKGLYAGIAHYFFLREKRGEAKYIERQKALLKFDANNNGLADRDELAAIRAARAEASER